MEAQDLKDMTEEQLVLYLQDMGARGNFRRYTKRQLIDSIVDNYERDCAELHSEMQ